MSHAYYLNFNSTDAYPSLSNDRWVGFSVYIVASPFYFSRGGAIDLITGSQRVININDNYWTDTPTSSQSNAYRLAFDSAGVHPTGSSNRFYGFSVYIVTSPFYFSRGGYIYLTNGSLRNLGNDGAYRASTSSTVSYLAYYFASGSGNIGISYSLQRWYGFSVH